MRGGGQTTQLCKLTNADRALTPTHSCSCVHTFLPTHASLACGSSQNIRADSYILSTRTPVDSDTYATSAYVCRICNAQTCPPD